MTQPTLKLRADNDKRRNYDREFERRAMAAQRKMMERTLSTPIPAQSGIEEKLFDVPEVDPDGQISLM